MKAKRAFTYALCLGLVLLLTASTGLSLAQEPGPKGDVRAQGVLGTGFTYQGRLTDGGNPANGTYDFLFTLFNPEGTQIRGPLVRDDVQVTDGLFTVYLDFGDYVFYGWERELEIAVRPGDSTGDYTILAPRQSLTAAPFALSLPGLFTVPNDFSPNVIGGYAGNEVWDDVLGGTISGGGGLEMENRVTDRFSAIGGGGNNLAGDESDDATDAWYATVGGGWENRAISYNATVSGGAENTASGGSSFVGGGYQNGATEMHATVAGGVDNEASAEEATVGGGGGNRATGTGSTIAGGGGNTAGGEWHSTVGGGADNNAGATHATISGGSDNQALEWAATVGGGHQNTASGSTSTIGGGFGNQALADFATIGGGGRTDGGNPDSGNHVTDAYGTIGGGGENLAGDEDDDLWDTTYATIGGGRRNLARHEYATIGGGSYNTADGVSSTVGGGEANLAAGNYATVAGGGSVEHFQVVLGNYATDNFTTVGGGGTNQAGNGWEDLEDAKYATVGGGARNTASGLAATVPGGEANTAQGDYSFAAGYRAKAQGRGSFVWADSTDEDFTGWQDDIFWVRASGGAFFVADNDQHALEVLNNGNGTGLEVYANSSKGNEWAAIYSLNTGTSPALFADTDGGTYAGYFSDPIYVNGGCIGCTMVYVGLNDGAEPLEVGDLVAVSGVGDPLAGASVPVMHVRQAGAGGAVIGVVQNRAKIVQSTKDGQVSESADRAEGAVQPGDYLFIVVQGIAQVKVDPAAGEIVPGQRLTAGEKPGHARVLRSQVLNGMTVMEGAPVIGVALAPPDKDGLVPVLVTLR